MFQPRSHSKIAFKATTLRSVQPVKDFLVEGVFDLLAGGSWASNTIQKSPDLGECSPRPTYQLPQNHHVNGICILLELSMLGFFWSKSGVERGHPLDTLLNAMDHGEGFDDANFFS